MSYDDGIKRKRGALHLLAAAVGEGMRLVDRDVDQREGRAGEGSGAGGVAG